MRQDIIDMMRAELYDDKFCHNDFDKYDLEYIKDSYEPFFWSVREYGTTLCSIGPTRMNKLFENEASRFQIFRDSDAPIGSLKYISDKGKVFFYDGFQLVQIQPVEVEVIYANIWYNEIERMKDRYPVDFSMCDKPLEIRMGDCVADRLNESKEFAKSINDTSLEECLKRLSKHSRLGLDHFITLMSDFTEHGYTFYEQLNGECRLAGGIIYHGNPNEGYKENDSVQLTPSYGWHIHT